MGSETCVAHPCLYIHSYRWGDEQAGGCIITIIVIITIRRNFVPSLTDEQASERQKRDETESELWHGTC